MSHTLGTLIDTHGVDVHDHLDRDELVPVHSGLQRQGDVLIQPRPDIPPATTPVPAAGVPVVRGENGGNTHLLLASGDVRCDLRQADARNLTLAVVTVAEGATGYLAHPEHAYTGIGPGTYRLTRQREQADELRMVAD
jgi:hypothetical protein